MSRVAICGKMGSGNRAIKRVLESAGLTCEIFHGCTETDHPASKRRSTQALKRWKPDRVVIPVRSEVYRLRSKDRDGLHAWALYEDEREMERRVLTATANLPTYLMSYEALVEHPEKSVALLLRWIGLEPLEPLNLTWLRDGNQKYR